MFRRDEKQRLEAELRQALIEHESAYQYLMAVTSDEEHSSAPETQKAPSCAGECPPPGIPLTSSA